MPIVLQHHGLCDKYIGDCIMAVWGTDPDDTSAVARAAIAACAGILQAIKKFNFDRRLNSQPEVHVGIGASTGPAVVGLIGSQHRLQYTVIGDSVNVASRLCSLAGIDECVLCNSTYVHVRDDVSCQHIGLMEVKGRTGCVDTYKLII